MARSMRLVVGVVLVLVLVCFSSISGEQEDDPDITRLEETGAAYLQNVMDQLQQDREEGQSVEIMELTNILNMERVSEAAPDHTNAPNLRFQSTLSGSINGPTPIPPLVQAEIRPLSPPPPALTTDELKAIYNAALTKGATLPQVQNGQHVSFPQPASSHNDQVVQPASQGVAGEGFPGYYYYFYPIKSFLSNAQEGPTPPTQPGGLTPPPLHPPMLPMDPNANKNMEPLFMAVTGFVGMALMFIVSVLFLPKLGNLRSDAEPELKEGSNELAVLGKLIFESMDGKDCTERIACEVGRFVRSMKMEKPFKIMEIVLPPNMSRQITLIRKAAAKKEKCNFIPCRFKSSRPPSKTEPISQPWKKGPSPHEQWMKHFEKPKNPPKKVAQNVWTKKT